MEKIKSLISHRKSQDETLDGNPAEPSVNVRKDGEHPIYDQMTNHPPATASTSSHPASASAEGRDDEPHHYSTGHRSAKTDSGTGPEAARQAQRSLQPEKAHHVADYASASSIKSGVVGYPPSSLDKHAALSNNNPAERQLSGDQILGQGKADHEDAGRSTGRAGETLSYEKPLDHSSPPAAAPVAAGTERSFPLTGGIKSEPQAQTTTRDPATNERGKYDGQGRGALAGAAAAATATSTIPSSSRYTEHATSGQLPRPDSKQIGNDHRTETAATTSNPHSVSLDNQERDNVSSAANNGQSGASSSLISSLLFTKGPHPTDTGNLFDPKVSNPHLHIPGEFPTLTPVEESREPSYVSNKGNSNVDPTTIPGTHQELRHTGTLDTPQTRSADDQSIEPTSSRDGAGAKAGLAAAGLGAGAGAGAYAAGKHHREAPQPGSETFKSEPSPYSSHKIDPRVDSKPLQDKSYQPAGTGVAAQPGSEAQDTKPEHHYGRDAALVGAGAGTAAGLYASQRSNQPDTGPASSTIGPHKSNVANILDPRVQPDPEKQKSVHKQDHQDGQNTYTAAPVGKVQSGASGRAKHEAAETYDSHRLTQPGAAMNEQRYDPNSPNAKSPSPVPSNIQVKGEPQTSQQQHYGRDAAIVGGLGAAGAGAYAATRGDDRTQQQQPPPSASQPTTQASKEPTHQRYDSVQQPTPDHDKRNLVAGTAAAAGVGGAAYAYSSQHDDAMKTQEQQLKDQQKAFDAQQKQQDKDLHHQQKQAEKQHAKDQKHHDKEVAAATAAAEKERQHAQQQDARQARFQEENMDANKSRTSQDGKEEKKHRLLPFLSRDKDAEDKSPRTSTDQYQNDSDTSEGKRERHRLHKDPPPGHPAREAMLQQKQGDDGRVIEPHTGLPMNVAKYGTDGEGGTDGSRTVHGYNAHQQMHQGGGGQGNGKGCIC